MELIWLGHSCVRLRHRDTVVMQDPFDRALGYNVGRWSADIVTVSHDHPGHNNASSIQGDPKVLTGPGEYDIAAVPIFGVATFHDRQRGSERGRNTAFVVELDEVRVCHLGDIGEPPNADMVKAIGVVDVLLVPVGGSTTVDAQGAVETVRLLEPKIIVPMHYSTPALKRDDLAGVEPFLTAMGVTSANPLQRLSVTATSLPSEPQVVVLDYGA
jgi:L-ascorbate metabolism protein UlaG (beta-lactamase superfamily)